MPDIAICLTMCRVPPAQVVWLTPLNSWNPYDIEYKGSRTSELGQTVTANGRNGGLTQSTALNGTNELVALFNNVV